MSKWSKRVAEPVAVAQHITSVRVRFVRDDAPFKRGDLKDCTVAEAEKFQRQGLVELEDCVFGVDD